MDTPIHILIVSHPGNFRDSLTAILKTVPQAELFPLTGSDETCPEMISSSSPAVLIIDLQALKKVDRAPILEAVSRRNPELRWVALAHNPAQTRAAYALGADYVLPLNASAGELVASMRYLVNSSIRIHPVTEPASISLLK